MSVQTAPQTASETLAAGVPMVRAPPADLNATRSGLSRPIKESYLNRTIVCLAKRFERRPIREFVSRDHDHQQTGHQPLIIDNGRGGANDHSAA